MLTSEEYRVLASFRTKPQQSLRHWEPQHEWLVERGFLHISHWAPVTTFVFTPEGLHALEKFEDQRDREAEQQRQQDLQRAQRIQDRKQERRDKWLIAVLSACGGTVLTLLIEHFQVILSFLSSLFH